MAPAATTHYSVLGVARDATHAEIKRGYHRQARRFHPDRVRSTTSADADSAEDSMRRVNEAWRVLSDPQRKWIYDQTLDEKVTSPRPGVTTSTDGVTRIDPRLLDPEFLAARRSRANQEVEYKNSWMLRALPMIGFMVLIIGIIVFTAYARTTTTTVAPTTTTNPGPQIGVDAGDCVRRLPESGLLVVPCTGREDGFLLAVAEAGATCPDGTRLTQPVRDGMTACLG